ncbi:MAG: hypothetical protein M1826_003362 [Phylliscum demangeonii]|nr:MAG: hypothetical protein M1826_003362 [Phylliscum demangeonii]
MSDLEDDEMDMDGPASIGADADDTITFSSDHRHGQGKRSAANLPVEAEDSLPWVEKYRPHTLADVAGHHDILATITKFVESNRLPHLLLYGPPGTGKTSTILALARMIYGGRNMRQMVLELNASDDRGIDVVREQIKTFASMCERHGHVDAGGKLIRSGGGTKQIFSTASAGGSAPALAAYKLIILDEADAMTSTAQMALRRIMEKYTANTRFCIIANYTHKLSPALLSRCTRFRFSPLKAADIRSLVELVIEREAVRITPAAAESLVALSKGDMRRALNVLQACHASSTPLRARGDPAPAPPAAAASVACDLITEASIYDCIAAPHPHDVDTILETLLNTTDVTTCLTTIHALKATKGLALADLLTALADRLAALEVPVQTRVVWLQGLADVEYRLSGGALELVQTGAVVGVVRSGCELMEHDP